MKKFYLVQIYISINEFEKPKFKYIQLTNNELMWWFTTDITQAKKFTNKKEIKNFLAAFIPKGDCKMIKIRKYYSI